MGEEPVSPTLPDLVIERARELRDELILGADSAHLIGPEDRIPRPVQEGSDIKVIIVGLDPIPHGLATREKLDTVLNWNKRGSAHSFVGRILGSLGFVAAKHLYVTNLIKCFLREPLTKSFSWRDFVLLGDHWLPLLKWEVNHFTHAAIVTLGDPTLQLILRDSSSRVASYWGHRPLRKDHGPFRYLGPADNRLGRPIFPFPHIQPASKEFYCLNFREYVEFIGLVMGWETP